MYKRKSSISAKMLALLVVLVLLIGITAGGSLALLYTKTDPIVNTFTEGNIDITLQETFTPNTEDGRYKALPGDVIAKAPSVKVEKGSVPCYVRVFVVNWWEEDTDSHFRGTEAAQWYNFGDFGTTWSTKLNYVDTTSGVKGHLTEFRYNQAVDATNGEVTITGPFSTITVPHEITGEKYASLDNYKVVILAQAVQAVQEGGNRDMDEAFENAGLPTVNLGLGEGAPEKLQDIINLHTQPSEGS